MVIVMMVVVLSGSRREWVYQFHVGRRRSLAFRQIV
jgi:hypothetical protein